MGKNRKLYVRIDYKVGEKNASLQDVQDHLSYVKNFAKEHYFIGGIFSNANEIEGICLFEAKSFEEAQKIFQCDPIIERGFYRYEIFEWNIVVSSEELGMRNEE